MVFSMTGPFLYLNTNLLSSATLTLLEHLTLFHTRNYLSNFEVMGSTAAFCFGFKPSSPIEHNQFESGPVSLHLALWLAESHKGAS